MQHQRGDSEGVTKGVGQNGGQEVGRLVAAQTQATEATAQAHIGVT